MPHRYRGVSGGVTLVVLPPGDSAYLIPVCNAYGAPRFYAPDHSDPLSAELNECAESCRSIVEIQIGRIGGMFAIASDDAGPWSYVGNGGRKGEGSELGMARSADYFMVCARLTALTQSMRGTYPRKPEDFFQGKVTEEEKVITLRKIQEAKARVLAAAAAM